ncbi:MAG: uridine kinase, partial [Butyricicoccus sp.]|nr:uridine kinase [Butyricicoccus sp.]
IPGGNMDLSRFREEVLTPALAGEAVFYRPYDCQTGSYRPAELIEPRPLTIIEGSYSLHPDLHMRYDLKIFLTSSPAAQTRRLKAREGESYRMFKTRWIPMEERYISRCHIHRDALSIDTSEFFD